MHVPLCLLIVLAPLPVAAVDLHWAGPDAPVSTPESAPSTEPEETLPADPAARAGVLFELGRFAEAASAFADAYVATEDPVFLFGRAQALRRAGNCAAAIGVLQAFIDTSPPKPDVVEAQRVIDACRAVLGEPDPEPQSEPEPVASLVDTSVPPDRERPPWLRDVPGGVLLGVGAFVTVAGVGTYAGAFAMARDRSEPESDFEDRSQRVRSTAAAGIVLMTVGGALIVGGIIRYAIVARRGGTGTVAHAPLRWRF
ncbi:MAG: hypothetical protein JKY37_25560 [Nannocystaceae bacterium]|nr:hypothetical protein [Nannocystaceae bacterium]